MSEEVIDVLKNMQQEMNNASGGLFERLKNIEIENGNLKQKNKELINKIKFNEKSRRKMQQSLMKQIDELEQQCKKQKEVIDKVKSAIKGDIDGFMTINEHGESQEILDLLEIYLQILEDKEVSE